MDDKLIHFLYKWDRLEKKFGNGIIDFDLLVQAGKYPGLFETREEALWELTTLIKEASPIYDKNQFIMDKLQACRSYLSALLGTKEDFESYVQHTLGVQPKLLPRSVLNAQLEKAKDAYEQVGYEYSISGLVKYEKDNLLTKEEIEKSFVHLSNTVVTKFISWLGFDVELDYRLTYVDVDTYWMNWISTDDKGQIVLQYNLNTRHVWVKGSTEFLVFHELCAHAIQALSWKNEIRKGDLHPFVGLTTVFTPEQFSMEGIAESLFYFYEHNPFSKYGLIAMHQDHLYWLVMNNAHIMVNTGISFADTIEFIESYLPNSNRKTLQKNLLERVNDPLYRTYQYIYGISLYHHTKIAEGMTQAQKRYFVQTVYKNLKIPKDLINKDLIY